MKKSTKEHLESITASDLEDFKHSAFMYYTAFLTKKEYVKLGVNAKGDYVVKTWAYEDTSPDDAYTEKYEFRFSTAAAAIERYTEIIVED